jgi:hypothetical protein
MTVWRKTVSVQLDEENFRYLEGVCSSAWPNLSRSAAASLIITEHRLLTEAGILDKRSNQPRILDSNALDVLRQQLNARKP